MYRAIATALAVTILAAPGAYAGLKTYYVRSVTRTYGPNVSPNPGVSQPSNFPPGSRPLDGSFLIEKGSRAVIDDSIPGSPVLKTIQVASDNTLTVQVPGLGGFLFVSDSGNRGSRGEFTGTGSTDTSIAWGLVTGWTITGATWCHSSPAFICGAARRENLETIRILLPSAFYDLGTWTFHGTGWTAVPYVMSRQIDTGGNTIAEYRGVLLSHGTIPALPLVGIALLGGGVLVGAGAALRRRRE